MFDATKLETAAPAATVSEAPSPVPASPIAQPGARPTAPAVPTWAPAGGAEMPSVVVRPRTIAGGHPAIGGVRRTVAVSKRYVVTQPAFLSVAELANEKLALWSCICGWTSLLLAILAIPAILLGMLSRDSSPRAGSNRAIGMALGYITIVIWFVVGCYFFLFKPMNQPEKTGKKPTADSVKTSAPAKK